jgi:calcineurin-like phosphoesterase family protein
MTKRYYTADTHLGHARIIELCGRPFGSVDEMNETIIGNINDTCAPEDELYILGDIALGKLDESLPLLKQIECRVFMVPGNHDRFSLAYQRKGDRMAEVERELERYGEYGTCYKETLNSSSEFLAPFLNPHGWPVKMSHYPYIGDSHGADRHADLRPRREGGPLIHGHVHGEWQFKDEMFNVGVDVNEFRPVSEERILEWLASI